MLNQYVMILSSSKNENKGFTLIEFVVVLVLVGIFSSFALPSFTDLSDEAELAQAQGIAAGLKVGIQSVKATFRAQGYTSRVQNLPKFGDETIDTNNIGFPIGIDKGNGNENIGQGNAGCVGVWNGVLDNPPSVSESSDSLDYRSYRHTASRVCSYVYRGNGDTGNQNTGQLIIRYDSRDGSVIVCGARADIPAC